MKKALPILVTVSSALVISAGVAISFHGNFSQIYADGELTPHTITFTKQHVIEQDEWGDFALSKDNATASGKWFGSSGANKETPDLSCGCYGEATISIAPAEEDYLLMVDTFVYPDGYQPVYIWLDFDTSYIAEFTSVVLYGKFYDDREKTSLDTSLEIGPSCYNESTGKISVYVYQSVDGNNLSKAIVDSIDINYKCA